MNVLLTFLGVAVPSLLVVLATRRWLERVPWKIALLLLALTFAYIARGVFTSGVPLPLDEVMRGYPYKGAFPDVKVKNDLTNDTVKQILPWMHVVREQFARGEAPLWNPYLFCGYPLLGNGQSAPFSPFFLATLFVPLPKQMVAMAGVKVFVALLFGYLLVRREGLGDGAAIFGSSVFAFAVFNNCFLYYPMTAVTLLLPAAAYATLLCLRERRAAPIVMLALVVASLLAGGHPESVFHVVIGVLALVAIEAIAPQWRKVLTVDGGQLPEPAGQPATVNRQLSFGWRELGRVTIAAVLGLVIGAPAWVPVLEQVLVSLRVFAIDTLPAHTYPQTALWAMLNPDGFGNPAHGTWRWYGSYTHVASFYLGLIVTALLPGALFSRQATRRDRLLVIAAILFFIIANKWTFLGDLFYVGPPLSWVAHDRLRFVVCFFAGIVAARTTARLHRDDLFWGLFASAILLGLGGWVFFRLLGKTLFWWSAGGLVLLILFWIFRRRAGLAAAAFTIAELFLLTSDYNAVTEGRFYAPRLPIMDALKAAAPDEPYRVLGRDWVFLPNAAAQYGLEDIRGSDPMEWADYVRFYRQFEIKDDSIDVKRIADPSLPVLDFLNVRYLLTEPATGLGGKWRRIYSGADGELYENMAVLPRFFAPRLVRRVGAAEWEGEVATIADYRETAIANGKGLPALVINPEGVRISTRVEGPREIEVRVAAPGRVLVASSQPAMAGWRVSGADLIRVNGAFLGFFAPAGESTVLIRYRPASWTLSLVAAGLGLLLLVGFARWNRTLGGGVMHGPDADSVP